MRCGEESIEALYLLLDEVRYWLKNNIRHYRTYDTIPYHEFEVRIKNTLDAINFKLRWSDKIRKEKIGE